MTLPLRPRLFNVTEYHQMGVAGIFGREEHVELIEGQILAMDPRDSVRHIWTVIDLNRIFARRDDVIVSVHNPLRIDERTEPEPDIVVLQADVPQNRHPSPAHTHLIVEVADLSLDYDREVKAPLYGKSDVPEYWLVDLNVDRIYVYREPSTIGFRSIRILVRGESLTPAFSPDMVIPVDDILGPPESASSEDQD